MIGRMLRWIRRHEVVGLEVLDREGEFVGTVRDTYPLDGGGEVQLLLVGVGRRFARNRYVPTQGSSVRDGKLHIPFARNDVEDCPAAEDRRWANPADVARGYWVTAGD
jgi:sporulation protein YlmC with PRC-barrel domain